MGCLDNRRIKATSLTYGKSRGGATRHISAVWLCACYIFCFLGGSCTEIPQHNHKTVNIEKLWWIKFLAESLLVADRKYGFKLESKLRACRRPGVGVGGTLFLLASSGNQDNPVGSQQHLCQSTNVPFPSCRFHVWPNFLIISHELSSIFLTTVSSEYSSYPLQCHWRGCKILWSKPWSRNNGSLAWMAPGKAICQGENAVPLSAIVECGGRLMRAGWFL